MIGLLPIDENEKLALLAGLDSLEDIIIDIHGNESEKPALIKYREIINPLKEKLHKIIFKF